MTPHYYLLKKKKKMDTNYINMQLLVFYTEIHHMLL